MILQVILPDSNKLMHNITSIANYTGLSSVTLEENLWPKYSPDYTIDGKLATFAMVFGDLFSGVTGIMAGANMSGKILV